MVKERKYIVRKGKKKIEVVLPAGLNLDTKRVILNTIKNVDNEEYITQSLNLLNAIVSEMSDLFSFLKQDNFYSPVVETTMRDIVGDNLSSGLVIGMNFAGSPEKLLYLLQGKIDLQKALDKVPADKRGMAEYVLYSLSLGSLSLKVGMIIGAFTMADEREKYLKRLGEEASYFI